MLLFTRNTRHSRSQLRTERQLREDFHRSRSSRRRLSVAPASTPEASALQPSFGLRENLGRGKLLGGGDSVKTEPENVSRPAVTMFPDVKILETASLGISFGSGPILFVNVDITGPPPDIAVDRDSSFLGLLLDAFAFFGVADGLLFFLLIGGVREGRDA